MPLDGGRHARRAMAINLSDYEAEAPYDGDYRATSRRCRSGCRTCSSRNIVHKRKAIVVCEGWDAAGKGGAIQRLTAECDPRGYRVWPIAAPTEEEKAHHYLWRFWQRLPAAGEVAIFDRSWYGRVLVERVEGFATEAEWRRAYDEINELEAQPQLRRRDDRQALLPRHPGGAGRAPRKRLDHPWKRWKVDAEDFRNRARARTISRR